MMQTKQSNTQTTAQRRGRYLRQKRLRARRLRRTCLVLGILMLAGAVLYGVCGTRADASTTQPSFTFPEDSPFTAATVETTEPDLEAPVISGAQDLTFYTDETAVYRSGVTVTDDRDPNPTLDVDSSAVDMTKPGQYSLIYVAVDASGNVAWEEVSVTVKEKPEGWVEPQTIYDTADSILSRIITPDMSVQEQVSSIYAYVRSILHYHGHSDRSDYVQTAYQAMRDGEGDCFGYFSVSKLLFERLGIPNIDVQKVRNFPDDSDHFWSLVSVDGGKTYYHFDATPRKGQVEDFCLVTDAFLDAYSAKHKNCHNRDTSLYPATPQTPPQGNAG